MKFAENFLWGTASAAYQIEGAYLEDGKGLNIWDAYCQEGNRVAHSENGNVACDHYHHFREDVKMMREMGIKNYRFSINWTRILPEGTGKINEKGLQFYSDLVDELLANGIEPLVTLFHWDYPLALHQKGGWLNRESSDWFAEYAKVVVDALSDRVKYWMTINEPQVFIGCGYAIGKFAPFEKHLPCDLTRMTHNVLLSHGKAVQVIRKYAKKKPVIGFAFATPCCTPTDNTPEAIEEARRKSFAVTRDRFPFELSWWADPIFFGKYPQEAYDVLGADMPEILPGDMEIISQPVNFYGVNIYESKATENVYGYAENAYLGCPRTQMGWPVTPEVLYWSPKFLYERYKKPVLLSENGMAGHDWVHLDGRVHDAHRIDFMKRYLRELCRSAEDGAEIMGYMYWSIMDNFEWADGYDKRFGLVHVDYQTQERTIKDSGYFYRDVIQTNGQAIFSDTWEG
ncbi:GH1 family beta-glucosidase [Ruminococcus sp.]|uniref:GH1 family beta-glucosidase n=1 Tax=Ruminococcus sp. TaxID=41978 RepID=UPI0025CBAD82|nr:GH1 family beta-glucosidase [Ruminococcus sp.]